MYEFDSGIKRQTKGGAIGLELTGDLAQIFMNWYDRQMNRKLEEKGVEVLLYQRYVDDINMIYIEFLWKMETTAQRKNSMLNG